MEIAFSLNRLSGRFVFVENLIAEIEKLVENVGRGSKWANCRVGWGLWASFLGIFVFFDVSYRFSSLLEAIDLANTN